MKQLFTLTLVFLLNFSAVNYLVGQNVDEIIDTYLETIGGVEKLASIKSMKMKGKANSFGMDFPITVISSAPNKMKMVIEFQGKEITQMAFDGETAWTTNFMTMEAEKMTSEQTKIFKETSDFPDAFLNYKDKGYVATLEGEEDIEGVPCFKVKLNKGTITVDDKEETMQSIYYFDKETYVPIMTEEFALVGEMKGKSTQSFFSDYDEVDGLVFPYTMSQKIDGQTMMEGTFETVEINLEVEDGAFAFPEK
jgi:hypothetical protein